MKKVFNFETFFLDIMHLINGQKTEKVENEQTLLPLLVTYIVRNYLYNTILLHQKQEKKYTIARFYPAEDKVYNLLCTKQIRHYGGEI